MHQNKQHIPVLLKQVLHYLAPQTGDSLLDVTAGYGGHAKLILDTTKNYEDSTLVDRDKQAINYLSESFDGSNIELLHSNFYEASQTLHKKGRSYDLILADLGVSSPHLNEASRGFAIHQDGPLDMRMDQTQHLNAEAIVNTYDEADLVQILKDYGEEPKARQIARLMVLHRPILSTTDLAKVVAQAWRGHSKVHPATRTFQALRIAVNKELDLLDQSLPLWIELLNPGGRIVVISYHSLEDRLVKKTFADNSGNRYDAALSLLTKKPVVSDTTEIVFNPRARSAKLRAAAKINNRKGST